MPQSPEHGVNVSVTDKASGAEEAWAFEQEARNLPDTAPKVAAFLRRALVEARNPRPGVPLSDEAEFVLALEETLVSFYRARLGNLPPERRPSLEYFISVLDGTAKGTKLPPDQVRELMEAVRERFGVPERHDLTIVDPAGEPVKNQPGRGGAHERILEGLEDAWGTLLAASWREHYTEHFPARVRGEVEDIATSDSHADQQSMIKDLVDRIHTASPYRFRRFMKALVDQHVGAAPGEAGKNDQKRLVVTAPELRALAAHVSSRLPKHHALSAEEVYALMEAAARERDRTPMPRETLNRIVEAFAVDVREVNDYSDPEHLLFLPGGENAIFNGVREKWAKFSNPQRAQFVELVRANFVAVPPKGGEGAAARKGRGVSARAELADLCRSIAKELGKEEPRVTDADVKLLAKLLEFRANEIVDYRTKPDTEMEELEAREQATLSPEALFADLRMRLGSPRAYLPPLLRTLRRPDMAAARRAVFRALQAAMPWLASGSGEREKRLQGLAGISFSEIDKTAVESVLDSGGEGMNKTGWELLLRAGNASHEFRDLVRTAEFK